MLHDVASVSVTTMDDPGTGRDCVDDSDARARQRRVLAEVPVGSLRAADSPRLSGLNLDHVRGLAEIGEGLPPILVYRPTMQVIDGMHRLSAARLNGQEAIQVEFFDGIEEEVFLLAVKANVEHGLPLTLADRRAAAERIVRTHRGLSDRAIATAVGLSAGTVAAIRRGSDDPAGPNMRIGLDGRMRPIDSADGRRIASELIAAHPERSLRKIARESGISLGTAHDVRERVRAGHDPVPHGARRKANGSPPEPVGRRGRSVTAPTDRDDVDSLSILAGLRRDPSLRYSERGRSFLRWLSLRILPPGEWRSAVSGISPHSAILVGKIARRCAGEWAHFADELERRSNDFAG
jgi:ParB-like chromosome segregation protein Spo0J